MKFGASFEARMNPDLANESLVERDVLGEVSIESDATREQAKAYRKELEEKAPDFIQKKMTDRDREALLQRGFRIVEGLWSEEQAIEPPKPFLRELRLGVRRALELPTKREKDLRIYSTVGHPLQEVLGIDGFVRINEKPGKKPEFVSFAYEINPRAAKDVADVMVVQPRSGSREEESAVNKSAHEIFLEYRRKKAARDAQRNNPHLKGGFPGGKF